MEDLVDLVTVVGGCDWRDHFNPNSFTNINTLFVTSINSSVESLVFFSHRFYAINVLFYSQMPTNAIYLQNELSL